MNWVVFPKTLHFVHSMNVDNYYLLLSNFIIVFLYPQIDIVYWLVTSVLGINQDYIPITSGVTLYNFTELIRIT